MSTEKLHTQLMIEHQPPAASAVEGVGPVIHGSCLTCLCLCRPVLCADIKQQEEEQRGVWVKQLESSCSDMQDALKLAERTERAIQEWSDERVHPVAF